MRETVDLLRILIIDDDPDRHDGVHRVLDGVADVEVAHPLDVTSQQLEAADLVSVDEYFQDQRWLAHTNRSQQEIPTALMPSDGLAVAASIRSQARALSRPLAITLHTGALGHLAGGLPAENREPLVAAQHDLEWVFEFGAPRFSWRLAEVAAATRSLLNGGTDAVSYDFGGAWLNLPEGASWASTAAVQLEDCRPPAHSLARDTRGLSYLRWLAHRVLPYPSFLLSANHSANLLGLTRESFESIEEVLQSAAYSGPLAGLLGKRWWRAGLQQVLVDSGVFQWDTAPDRVSALQETFGRPLEALSHDEPVVAYDEDGRVVDINANPDDAVRLQQDGWPVWADDPWASIQAVKENAELRQLVAKLDRQKLMDRES